MFLYYIIEQLLKKKNIHHLIDKMWDQSYLKNWSHKAK